MPHKTILLDCPPERGLARVGSPQTTLFDMSAVGRLDAEGSRRFEEEPLAFHKRVRAGYLALAKADPARWAVIDAEGTEDEVFERVWAAATRIGSMRSALERAEKRRDDAAPSLELSELSAV